MAIGQAPANAPVSENTDMAAEIPVVVNSGPCRRRPGDPVPDVASKRLRAQTSPFMMREPAEAHVEKNAMDEKDFERCAALRDWRLTHTQGACPDGKATMT